PQIVEVRRPIDAVERWLTGENGLVQISPGSPKGWASVHDGRVSNGFRVVAAEGLAERCLPIFSRLVLRKDAKYREKSKQTAQRWCVGLCRIRQLVGRFGSFSNEIGDPEFCSNHDRRTHHEGPDHLLHSLRASQPGLPRTLFAH